MSRAACLIYFQLFPAVPHGQAALPVNRLDPLFQETLQTVKINWRDDLILVAAVVLVIALTFAVLLWLRKARRPKSETLHRSPWPASARKNQPHPTPLLATGAFRQRRRRRARPSH